MKGKRISYAFHPSQPFLEYSGILDLRRETDDPHKFTVLEDTKGWVEKLTRSLSEKSLKPDLTEFQLGAMLQEQK